MTHNARCADVNPKSRCRCTCGGRLHGMKHEDEVKTQDRSVNEYMGGELGEMITKLQGQKFTCTCHKNPVITIRDFMAYPHDGGLADKDGNKWWLYVTCQKCLYDWSWYKVEHRAEWFKAGGDE